LYKKESEINLISRNEMGIKNSWYELMGEKRGKIRNISLICVCAAPPSHQACKTVEEKQG
jgi:hypothetical protein